MASGSFSPVRRGGTLRISSSPANFYHRPGTKNAEDGAFTEQEESPASPRRLSRSARRLLNCWGGPTDGHGVAALDRAIKNGEVELLNRASRVPWSQVADVLIQQWGIHLLSSELGDSASAVFPQLLQAHPITLHRRSTGAHARLVSCERVERWSNAAGGGRPFLRAAGQSLHHVFLPQRLGLPNAILNAGFNYLPLTAEFNSWMNGSTIARRAVEWGVRGVVAGIYGGLTGASSGECGCK